GCVSHRSQVPLPFPAFRTPPEGAPRRVDRDGRPVGEFHQKVNSGMKPRAAVTVSALELPQQLPTLRLNDLSIEGSIRWSRPCLRLLGREPREDFSPWLCGCTTVQLLRAAIHRWEVWAEGSMMDEAGPSWLKYVFFEPHAPEMHRAVLSCG